MSEALVVGEATVETETWSDAVRGEISFRTLFGEQPTTPEFTAGVADLAPGGWLGHHRHQPGEIYYILDGEGTVTIDGKEHVVAAATAIYIPGNSEHGIRNSGDSLLRFFYALAVGGSFDQIEYRFTADQ